MMLGPLFAVFIACIVFFYVLFVPIAADGDSMLPSLRDGERILITRSYKSPTRGDVIIFDGHREDGSPVGMIKRVIALPGDTVEIREGIAYANGVPETTQSRILEKNGRGEGQQAFTVPDGHLFVLGDNRPISLDSRFIGPIPLSSVRGRAVFIMFPFDQFGKVE